MAANKIINFGPFLLTTTLTTNLINCNITSLAGPIGFTITQPYLIIRHIRILNRLGASATFSLWKGLTGGNVLGTEVVDQGTSVPGNQAFDYVGLLRLDAADFLVGGAGSANALVFLGEGEIGFV